jgi:hypothetical protein
MSFNLGLGAFFGESSEIPSLDHFQPQISFSKLATKFFPLNHIEDQCFVPHLCLDGHHQGATIAHETTHNEYLCMHKIQSYVAWPRHGVPHDADNGP